MTLNKLQNVERIFATVCFRLIKSILFPFFQSTTAESMDLDAYDVVNAVERQCHTSQDVHGNMCAVDHVSYFTDLVISFSNVGEF